MLLSAFPKRNSEEKKESAFFEKESDQELPPLPEMEMLTQAIPQESDGFVSLTATQEAEMNSLFDSMADEVNEFCKNVEALNLKEFKNNGEEQIVSCLSLGAEHDDTMLSNDSLVVVHHCPKILHFPLVCSSTC